MKAGFASPPALRPHPCPPLFLQTSLPPPCPFPADRPSLFQTYYPFYTCPSSCLSNPFYLVRAVGAEVAVSLIPPSTLANPRPWHPFFPPHPLQPTRPQSYFSMGPEDPPYSAWLDLVYPLHRVFDQTAGSPLPRDCSLERVFYFFRLSRQQRESTPLQHPPLPPYLAIKLHKPKLHSPREG